MSIPTLPKQIPHRRPRTNLHHPPSSPRSPKKPRNMRSQWCTIISIPLLFPVIFIIINRPREPTLSANQTTRTTAPTKNKAHRGVLMSCPPGGAHTNRGPWKPSKMTLGIEAVLRQQVRHNSKLPFFLAYYTHEESVILPFCEQLSSTYSINISCFKVPEKYPVGLYGYAKIFAIRHVPLAQVLWLDCDVFPVRRLDDLFDDPEFLKTGAMFWADSRDFFDETKLKSVLPKPAKKLFPTDAWYVRQGFDSGILLLDTQKSHQQIEEMCRIATSSKARLLRSLSMGDKDIFHIVWMRYSKNFTLIPYIGETGSLQTRRSVRKSKHLNNPFGRRVHWVMSSQVKHGRDGSVYALHQLHQQHPLSLIATLSEKQTFFDSRVTRSTSHVKPFLKARQDLRLTKPGYRNKPKIGDFLGDVEGALIGSAGIPKRVDIEHGAIHRPFGVRVEWTPNWIHAAAAEMGRVWRHGIDADSAARAIYQDHRKMLLMKRVSGGYRKMIYKRLWKEGGGGLRHEGRRRNVRRFRKRDDEERAIRRNVGG